MKRVAKLVIIDTNNRYLLLYRNGHPTFGNDPDLPGGTAEEGELPLETMIREVAEEVGAVIDAARVREVYGGTNYSAHGTHYSLFVTEVPQRPNTVLSWEHSAYEWLDRAAFLEKAAQANDTYMHMVSHVLGQAPYLVQ
jgi:8-oxo-dGTP pyrophosphatase MutT (NUDIX family)